MKNTNLIKTIFLLLFLTLFTSCFKKSIDNSNRIYFNYGWKYSTIGEPSEFISLPNDDLSHLSNLLDNRTGYVFLKKDFYLSPDLRHKDLSIFVGRLKIAAKVYINGHLLGQSGFFPPHEFTAGERSAYFSIPKEYLNFDKTNTLMICIWCHDYGSIRSTPFISLTEDIANKAEFENLINSKIYMIFSAFLIIVFFMYIFLFFLQKTQTENMSFALLCLSTAFYLVVFYIGEYSIIYKNGYSFLLFEKIFNGTAPILTCHFIICFTRDFLGYKEKKSVRFTRIFITLFCIILIFLGTDIVTTRILLRICFITMVFLFIYPLKLIIKSFRKRDPRVFHFILCFIPVYLSLIIQFISHVFLKKNVNSLMLAISWILVIFLFLGMLILNFVKLSKEVEFMNKNLENLVKVRTDALENEKKRALKEIELASFVQQSFLKIDTSQIENWEIEYYSKPMAGVSGDLYMCFKTNNKLDGFGIFDISGHGIASGLVTMLVKNIIEQEFYKGINKPLEEVMNLINERVIIEKGNIENYLTGMIIRIKDDRLEIVNAGHPKALLYNSQKDELYFIEKENINQYGTIGIDAFPVLFQSFEFKMNINDEIILYTDGITEATNPEKKDFGVQGIINMFNKYKHNGVYQQVMAVQEELSSFTGTSSFNDDITYIILKLVK